ncbi:YqaJ viral recombinase family protein [Roseomonas chloroacetimidivorans]|uniref:YqaJ viral recombinase family protein n=1 Tax=Roseomonas chloroacetimidivorans TaxID=1766656 RepID=UPI003C737C3C
MPLFPIPDDKDAWHAIRAQHIGASEVATLFSVQPEYMPGLFALWQVKAGRIPPENVDNARTRAGLALEEAIALLAAEREGWKVQPGQYAKRGGLGATLDRIIAEPGPNDTDCSGPGVLELKNADWLIHKREWGTEPPRHILLQLQAQMLASGFTWGAVAVLVGGNDVRIYRYRPRPRIQAAIAQRVDAFWASVKAGRVPNADGSDGTWRALQVLEPEIVDEEADLTAAAEEAAACAAALAAARQAKRDAEKREGEARNRLAQLLGGHRWGRAGDFLISAAEVAAVPDREAKPGEIIKGRAGSRRIIVKEVTA